MERGVSHCGAPFFMAFFPETPTESTVEQTRNPFQRSQSEASRAATTGSGKEGISGANALPLPFFLLTGTYAGLL